MEVEIGLALLLLIALSILATVDMAFDQLSDVGLRRLIGENERQAGAPQPSFSQASTTEPNTF